MGDGLLLRLVWVFRCGFAVLVSVWSYSFSCDSFGICVLWNVF